MNEHTNCVTQYAYTICVGNNTIITHFAFRTWKCTILVLRLLYVFRVCLFVCLFVRPHLSRAQYVTSYVTVQLQYIAAFGGLQAKLQQMKVVVSYPDGENVVGSRTGPVFGGL